MSILDEKRRDYLTEAQKGAVADQQREFGRLVAAAFRAANQKLDYEHEVLKIGFALIEKTAGTGPIPNARNLMNHVLQQHRLKGDDAADISRNASFHSEPSGGGGQPYPR